MDSYDSELITDYSQFDGEEDNMNTYGCTKCVGGEFNKNCECQMCPVCMENEERCICDDDTDMSSGGYYEEW